jgi:hypothetical protein
VQWVILKMLPFDNKSEFQVVVDMPAGTPLENTAAALHEMGVFLSKQKEVLDVQTYAGTASPITFNGLVRQYYLRADAEQGDLQVNLVDRQQRSEKSHAIAQRLRPQLEKIALLHGANIKVVEVPPGPPVMSPLVAEIYGPDEAGRQALAANVAKAFAQTPGIVGIDTSLKADAPRQWLQVRLYMVTQLEVKFGVFRHDSTSAPCTQPVIPPGATAVIKILLQESPQTAAVLVADDSLWARHQPPARRPPAVNEVTIFGCQPTETGVAPADGEVGGPLHRKVEARKKTWFLTGRVEERIHRGSDHLPGGSVGVLRMRVLHSAPNQSTRVFATGSGKPFQPGRVRHAVVIEKCQQIGRGRVSTPIPIPRDATIRAGQMHQSQPTGKLRHDIDHRNVGCVHQHNFELIRRQRLRSQRFKATS